MIFHISLVNSHLSLREGEQLLTGTRIESQRWQMKNGKLTYGKSSGRSSTGPPPYAFSVF